MRTIGIIPVRSGSKRFPDKNFSEFKDTTLIKNTISKLQKAHITDIIISTDVVNKLIHLPVMIMERPTELAQDTTTQEEVILDIISKIQDPDNYTIVLAQVTTPNWSPHRLSYALNKLEHKKVDSIVSVSPDYKPNGAFYIIHKDTFLKHKKLYTSNMYLVKMSWEESTDIDYEYQLQIARALAVGNYDY